MPETGSNYALGYGKRGAAAAVQIPAFGREHGNAALFDANMLTLLGDRASASAFTVAAGATLEFAGGISLLTCATYSSRFGCARRT